MKNERPGISNCGATIDAIETSGEVFADGHIIELVREQEASRPSLLLWDGTSSSIGQRFEHAGRTYVTNRACNALQHVRLPRAPHPFASTRKLFDELAGVFISRIGVEQADAYALTYFLFSDWLVDALDDAPCLSIVAPAGAPSADLFRLLEVLCRRAIKLAELSRATFRELPTELQPTLLLNVPSLSRAMESAIRASNQRGYYVTCGMQLVETFCAKVICTPTPLRDPALLGFPLEITLAPRRNAASAPLDRATCERLAEEFQGKLLAYRLANRCKCSGSTADVSSLSAATQPLARQLMSCVGGDDELQSGVIEMLRAHDDDVVAAHAEELSAIVLEGLLVCCHEAKDTATGREISELSNAILVGRGDPRDISPESVGWRLKGLGFHTEPIGRLGRGLRFSNAIRSRIHDLARAFGVVSVRGIAAAECPYGDWRRETISDLEAPAGGVEGAEVSKDSKDFSNEVSK